MANGEDELPTPRAGTYADLSRRMDRMENRHEDLATQVRSLAASVQRVEQGLDHAEKLNELRFNAQNQSLATLDAKVSAFITRIEGIIEGTVETGMSRQNKQMLDDYFAWRRATDTHLDSIDLLHAERDAARKTGLTFLSGAKGLVIMLAAILSPLIAAVSVLLSGR